MEHRVRTLEIQALLRERQGELFHATTSIRKVSAFLHDDATPIFKLSEKRCYFFNVVFLGDSGCLAPRVPWTVREDGADRDCQ